MSQDTVSRNEFVPVVLRLALGTIFLVHGVNKITEKGGDWGASWAFSEWATQQKPPAGLFDKLDSLAKEGKPPPGEKEEDVKRIEGELANLYAEEAGKPPETLQFAAVQLAVAWGEVLCGLLLLLGCMTRLAAVLMIVVQAGAIFTVTWAKGFLSYTGGWEYNFVLIAMCLALIVSGGGAFSVDRWWARKRHHKSTASAGVGTPVAV